MSHAAKDSLLDNSFFTPSSGISLKIRVFFVPCKPKKKLYRQKLPNKSRHHSFLTIKLKLSIWLYIPKRATTLLIFEYIHVEKNNQKCNNFNGQWKSNRRWILTKVWTINILKKPPFLRQLLVIQLIGEMI